MCLCIWKCLLFTFLLLVNVTLTHQYFVVHTYTHIRSYVYSLLLHGLVDLRLAVELLRFQ